jgi:hypothetical protein
MARMIFLAFVPILFYEIITVVKRIQGRRFFGMFRPAGHVGRASRRRRDSRLEFYLTTGKKVCYVDAYPGIERYSLRYASFKEGLG